MEGKEGPKQNRSFTPFLKEARDGDEGQERLLRIAIAHGFTDIRQFKSIGPQGIAQLLAELNKEEGGTPLTEAELEEQARMRYWLPKDKKYKKTK